MRERFAASALSAHTDMNAVVFFIAKLHSRPTLVRFQQPENFRAFATKNDLRMQTASTLSVWRKGVCARLKNIASDWAESDLGTLRSSRYLCRLLSTQRRHWLRRNVPGFAFEFRHLSRIYCARLCAKHDVVSTWFCSQIRLGRRSRAALCVSVGMRCVRYRHAWRTERRRGRRATEFRAQTAALWYIQAQGCGNARRDLDACRRGEL